MNWHICYVPREEGDLFVLFHRFPSTIKFMRRDRFLCKHHYPRFGFHLNLEAKKASFRQHQETICDRNLLFVLTKKSRHNTWVPDAIEQAQWEESKRNYCWHCSQWCQLFSIDAAKLGQEREWMKKALLFFLSPFFVLFYQMGPCDLSPAELLQERGNH